MLSFSNIQLLIQSSMMWITNVALEIGKLFNKQNNRKKKTKNLLLFATTIPFMTHDPILFYSFFHSQNFSLLKTLAKKCLPIYDSSKNLMLLMFFTGKIETFHSIYMRVVYILVFLYLHRFWYSHSFLFHPRTDKLKKHILKSTMTLFKVSTHRKFYIIFLAQKK